MHGRLTSNPPRLTEAERRRLAYASALEGERRLARANPPVRLTDSDSLRCLRCRELAHLCPEHAPLVVELL